MNIRGVKRSADAELKEVLIGQVRVVLPQMLFSTLRDYADTLFDLNLDQDDEIQARIDVLKTIPLSDIEYLDKDKLDFFTLKDRNTGESVQFSNRSSSKGEFRGEVLRNYLDQRQTEAPEDTVFAAITNAINTQENSDILRAQRSAFTSKEATSPYGDNVQLSDIHFDLFISILRGGIQEKIQNKNLPDELNIRILSEDMELQSRIWEGVDIGSIYDSTKVLAAQLPQIKVMSEELAAGGYSKASQAAATLHEALTTQMTHVAQGKLSVQDFGKHCEQAIEQAQQSELKNHRGFFGKVFHALKTVLSHLTFGAVSITPTQSIKKTLEMKALLREIVESGKRAPAESVEQSVADEPMDKSFR